MKKTIVIEVGKRAKPGSTAMRDKLAALGMSPNEMIEAGVLEHGEDVAVPHDRIKGRIKVKVR
jgi:DNA primase